ncbi:MAG: hypothetical protein AAFY99_07700 [Pseudomonadota bacterium]
MRFLNWAKLKDPSQDLPASIACVTAAGIILALNGFSLEECRRQPFSEWYVKNCELPSAAFWPLLAGAGFYPAIAHAGRKYGLDRVNKCLLVLISSGLGSALLLPFFIPSIMPDTFLAGVIAGLIFCAARSVFVAKLDSSHDIERDRERMD